jgi:hypothetical protein
VLAGNPHMGNPFADATEVKVTGRDKGIISLANGYQSHGEPVRLVRAKTGAVTELQWAANQLRPEAQVAAHMRRRYGGQ